MNNIGNTGNNFEIWQDIKGFELAYQISNLGNIKSLNRYVNGRYGNKILIEGKILQPQINKQTGYKVISLWKKNVLKTCTIHRLVALHFIPNPENKPQVNHIKGNKLDCRWFMLEWCTNKENCLHAKKFGLLNIAKGEKAGKSKLSETQVLEIRKQPSTKTLRELGKIYNVSKTNIEQILKRKSWKHI